MRAFVLVLLLPLVVPGCGQPAGSEAPRSAHPSETVRTTLYFLAEDGTAPLGVRREVAKDEPPPEGSTLRGALKALLAGPTEAERAAGFTSAVPPGTEFLSMTSRDDGATVVLDLKGLSGVDDGLDRARIITQIVRTLTGVSGVDRVWLRDEGQPWGMWLMKGGVTSGPFDYSTLRGFHLGAACPGTETVECDYFDALP
jgi:spore germination protein GerM